MADVYIGMRKINKQIILLSIILATVFMNSSSVYANATSTNNRRAINKNQVVLKNKDYIETSFKNNDYNLFVQTLKNLNIKDTVTKEQFAVLVNAYNLFKNNKQVEAVKLLKDNNINPLLIKFVNNRQDLTDAQKDSLKKASDLIKQGKIDEAKAILSSIGLDHIPQNINQKINKVENKLKKNEFKNALDQARDLRKQGKIDEAKKVLKDAGVPDQITDKIQFSSTTNRGENKGLFQTIKNLFIK